MAEFTNHTHKHFFHSLSNSSDQNTENSQKNHEHDEHINFFQQHSFSKITIKPHKSSQKFNNNRTHSNLIKSSNNNPKSQHSKHKQHFQIVFGFNSDGTVTYNNQHSCFRVTIPTQHQKPNQVEEVRRRKILSRSKPYRTEK